MAHIAVDAREYSASTGRYVSRLLEYLQHLDKANKYSVLLKPEDMDKAQFTNPNFHKVACPFKEFTLSEQLGYARQLYSLKADLVHFGMTQQPILYFKRSITTINDLTVLRFINPTKNPLVYRVKRVIYAFLTWYAAHKSKHILTYTDYVANDVAQYAHVRRDKFTTTYLAADPFPPGGKAWPGLAGKDFIMYVGRPMPHKNLRRLIDAHQTLLAKHPKLLLVLCGKTDDMYKIHQKYVKANGLKNVIFAGFVPDPEFRWMLEHCRAYVFPGLSEGFGLPALEAMQAGAPVVSSNASCAPEVYGDGVHYVDPLDVQSISDGVDEVLTDKQLRARLIAAGRAQAAKYSWKRCAQQTLAVYNQVLGQK